jgi:hypothetical protein
MLRKRSTFLNHNILESVSQDRLLPLKNLYLVTQILFSFTKILQPTFSYSQVKRGLATHVFAMRWRIYNPFINEPRRS